jgi:hypothetical protein
MLGCAAARLPRSNGVTSISRSVRSVSNARNGKGISPHQKRPTAIRPLAVRLAAVLRAPAFAKSAGLVPDGRRTVHTEDRCGVVRRASRAAKVQPEGVHLLRHTFCSHLAMRGAPARAISGTRWPPGSWHDAAIHALESRGARRGNSSAGSDRNVRQFWRHCGDGESGLKEVQRNQ